MRAAFRLILLFSVLWCGVHLTMPAAAAANVEAQQVQTGSPAETAPDTEDAVHAGHHHCPAAGHLSADALTRPMPSARTLPYAPASQPLASRSQAPPTQPPSA